MKFAEIDLFGVYVAPISVMLLLAWLATIALRRMAAHLRLLHHVWHPALFVGSVYVIVLSVMIFVISR